MTSLVTVAPAVGVSAFDLSGRTLLALLPLFVLAAALIVYCMVDLVRAPSVRYLPKPAWALVILFASVPFGPVAYLLLGRDRSGSAHQPSTSDADASRDDHAAI